MIVQHGGLALRFGHVQALRHPIDGNDLISAEHVSTANGKLAYRPAAPDRHGVAPLDVAVFCGHVTSGKDIGQKQYLLVPQAGRNFDRTDVGKGHTHVFRLSPCIAAQHVRVAKESGRGVAVDFFRRPGVRV